MRYTLYMAGGLAAAIFLMGLVLLLLGRHDRRLRSRDEMADALGCSVVASVRARRPRTVAAWSRLLSSYSADTVDAWALRQVLHRVRTSATTGEAGPASASTIVIALSDDPGGLAIAPQLASYAAATGVPTRFVAHGRHESAAALWAASHEVDATEPREGLRVGAEGADAALTVALVVMDRRDPQSDDLTAARAVAGGDEHTTILVALAAGSATAQELARVAVLLDDQDLGIGGLVVADPDDLDRTTGRMADVGRQAPPSRLAAVHFGPPGSPAGAMRRPR